MLGKTLAHYEIVAKIGEGGMGAVYRARDTKLGRDVALKLLPEHLTGNADRTARFRREATMLAAFSHPNVAAIHALEEDRGRQFLVMEVVAGEDLGERIQRGPLPVTEALGIARRVAAAMQAAHDKGIVHRDLKPQNVMIDPEGAVKVLDFGLAKMLLDDPDAEAAGSGSNQTLPPTMTSEGTRAGTIVGTAAFMSPEQARGLPVDSRADIWAFGCVLFAMLTGRTPFPGETLSDTIAAVLKSEPDWTALPPEAPPRLRDLLERCLAKDLSGRLRDVGDARIEIERTLAGHDLRVAPGAVPDRPRRRVGWWVVAVAAVAGLLLGAVLLDAVRGPGGAGPTPPTELSLTLPESYAEPDPLLSPDGRLVGIGARPVGPDGTTGERRLYLRDLGSSELRPVPGSTGLRSFAFSSDGRWLAMLTPVDLKSDHRRLTRIPTDLSSPPLELQDLPQEARGPLVWLPDGSLVVRTFDMGYVVVPADGGPAQKREVESDASRRYYLRRSPATVLPDGRHILVSQEVWGDAGYRQDLATLEVETGRLEAVLENAGHGLWSASGHLLFAHGTTLLAVPFDPQARRTTGRPVALTDGLFITEAWSHGAFDLSRDGTLLYQPGGLVGDRRQIMFLDNGFREIGPWSDERHAFEGELLIAPDGSRLAAVVAGLDGVFDTWLGVVERPSLNLFLDDPQRDNIPTAFSADGGRLYHIAYDNDHWGLYSVPVTGGESTLLLETSEIGSLDHHIDSVTPDGRWLVLSRVRGGADYDLVLLPAEPGPDGPAPPRLLVENASDGYLSRDGRWLAYESAETGRLEVCARRFHGDGSLGPVVRISNDGGQDPTWYLPGDGAAEAIAYREGRRFMVASFDAERGVRVGTPRPLTAAQHETIRKYIDMEQLPDGRFLGTKQDPDESEGRRFVVVLGFGAQLED